MSHITSKDYAIVYAKFEQKLLYLGVLDRVIGPVANAIYVLITIVNKKVYSIDFSSRSCFKNLIALINIYVTDKNIFFEEKKSIGLTPRPNNIILICAQFPLNF